MKRIIAMTLLASAASICAFAQDEVFNSSDNRPYFGVRIGWDYTVPSTIHFDSGTSTKLFKSGSGVSVGAIYNIPIVANFYFEPGASLFYDTYRYDDLTITDESGIEVERNPRIEKFGLRVPLRFGYRFNLFENGGVSLFTGFDPSVAFSGKVALKSNESKDQGISTNVFNGFYAQQRFDIAWSFGLGIHVDRWEVDVVGSLGMIDMQKGDGRFHENRISISAGYNF